MSIDNHTLEKKYIYVPYTHHYNPLLSYKYAAGYNGARTVFEEKKYGITNFEITKCGNLLMYLHDISMFKLRSKRQTSMTFRHFLFKLVMAKN